MACTQLWPSLGAKFSPAGTDELVRYLRCAPGAAQGRAASVAVHWRAKLPAAACPLPAAGTSTTPRPPALELGAPAAPAPPPPAARWPPLPPTSPARSPAPLLPGRSTTTRRAWGAACAGWRRCPAPRRWPWQCATRTLTLTQNGPGAQSGAAQARCGRRLLAAQGGAGAGAGHRAQVLGTVLNNFFVIYAFDM